MAISRRFSGFLAISAATLFLVGFFLFGSNRNRQFSYKSLLFSETIVSDDTNSSDTSFATNDGGAVKSPLSDVSQKPLSIAIVETTGYHDEVVAAFVHSFGSQKRSNLSLFQQNQRYGIEKIMKDFKLPKPVPAAQPPDMLLADDATKLDILVLTTCEYDRIKIASQLEILLKEGKTQLLCVVHHADHWANEDHQNFMAPWIDKGLVDFITLSQHTATFLQETGMRTWKTKPPIRPFAPVFPVNLPKLPTAVDADKGELGFGLQGLYESTRRNYETIFAHLQKFIDSRSSERVGTMNSNVTLHLLGQGIHPEVPSGLISHVSFDESLDYDEYYSILSRTFALLPAFANDQYLDRKASSTVPAGLIGGTPLVATKEIVAAYSYLPEDAVYLQDKDETEFDVIGRVLKDAAKHRIKKMQMVRNKCAELVKGNSGLVEGWIKEILQKEHVGR
ncbi:hypothetical protein HO133_000888 [Letharia lupina]|uniref:Uncharacterized protein n=1 Tax=Letharia lupina TaxID=560253 RepID=A0A8H6CG49_9LECA|nr:uncharacterized protein HO133_000888 [Letharia lupina]KAF6222837.1 hypothetical protein HO133_000888 [Letharia lupina]